MPPHVDRASRDSGPAFLSWVAASRRAEGDQAERRDDLVAVLTDSRPHRAHIDGVLAFAEHVVTNASRLWIEAELDRKQWFQQALFPEGLSFNGRSLEPP